METKMGTEKQRDGDGNKRGFRQWKQVKQYRTKENRY